MDVSKEGKLSRLRITSLLLLVPLALPLWGKDASDAQLHEWVIGRNVPAVRALGQPVLPKLVRMYESAGDDSFKARVAEMLYGLGWESPEAKQALMKDIHTLNQDLRLQVQWALGRVSK